MKISDKIKKRLLEDNDFSLDLCKDLKIPQQTLNARVRRDSKKLGDTKSVVFFLKNGFSLEEILVNEEDISWYKNILKIN